MLETSISLTEDQEEKYQAIRWLLSSGPFRSGKSTMMAMAFIEQGLRDLGSEVLIFDHNRNPQCSQTMLEKIEGIFKTMRNSQAYYLKINKSNCSITINWR